MSPGAATISVRATLDLLDGPFVKMANGIGEKQYALWLGSGISRERVDGLPGLIKRVLEYLRVSIDSSNPNCRFLRALNEILALAMLSSDEAAHIRLDRNIDDWTVLPIILQRLTGRYAQLLDVRVEGEAADFLLWDVVDVRNTFAVMAPDCEHLCVAILAIEGVISDIVSGNWDGLVEAAVIELDGGAANTLRVCVRSEDLRDPPLRARLVKFHGCAIRAADHPDTYRPLLVGRQSQITDWPHDPTWEPIKNELVSLAATRRTLMVGLSAQDSNIQDIFSAAKDTMPWLWPCDPPAHVFAEENLGDLQKNILRFVYRDAYDSEAAAVEGGAKLPAFGKPLLTALVLYIWCSKLQAFVKVVEAPGLTEADRALIGTGLKLLRDRLGDAAAGSTPIDFLRLLIRESARCLTLFQQGHNPSGGAPTYRALGSVPVHQIENDPTLPTSGIREMAAALGLLGLGEQSGLWNISNGDSGVANGGVLGVKHFGGTSETRVFFSANNGVDVRLEANGIVVDDDGDAVVIHSTTPIVRMTRSPRSVLGRTGKTKARHVDMNMLLRDAVGINDLQSSFRTEAAL
jgi:hypothetical protein